MQKSYVGSAVPVESEERKRIRTDGKHDGQPHSKGSLADSAAEQTRRITEAATDLPARYGALPSRLRAAIDALSFVPFPVSMKVARSIANQAWIGDSPPGSFSAAQWREAVEQLAGLGLLVEDERYIQCHQGIANIVARKASRNGDVAMWRGTYQRYLRWGRANAERGGRYWYPQKHELLEGLRLALFLNEAREFSCFLDRFERSYPADTGLAEVFGSWAGSPVDAEWLASRAPEIRSTAVNLAVEGALLGLAPAEDAVNLLKATARTADASDRGRQIIVNYHLLRGEFDEADKWLVPETAPVPALLNGQRLCMRGDYGRAVKQFEAGIRLLRKQSGKRDVMLGPLEAAFFAIAQFGTGAFERIESAKRHLDLAIRKNYGDLHLTTGLRRAADLANGLDPTTSGSLPEDSLGAKPTLRLLLTWTAISWVDRDRARAAIACVEQLGRQARAAGYAWAAAECGLLLARVDPGRHDAANSLREHERLGTVPLLRAIPEDTLWQRRLDALVRISQDPGTHSAGPSHDSRLTWRIQVDGAERSVKAYEQRCSRSGKWSSGGAISLTHLCDRTGLDFMSPHDERVCQAIESDTNERTGRRKVHMDVDRALLELAGHPLVFRADSPGMRVEVVRRDPELRVVSEGETVRVQLIPDPPIECCTVAAYESPTRLLVWEFSPAHRRVYSVTGSKGLAVPAGEKEQIVRAVSFASRLVTVNSDVESSDSSAEKAIGDPTPHFQLTPFGEGLQIDPVVRPFREAGPTYAPGEGGETVFATIGGQRSMARRNHDAERQRHRDAVAECRSLRAADWDGSRWTLSDAAECFELVDELHALGDRVVVEWPRGEALRIADRADLKSLKLRVRTQADWFAISGEVKLDSGVAMELGDLLDRITDTKGRFLPLGERGFLALTDRFRRHVEELAALVESHKEGLRFHASRVPVVEELLDGIGSLKADRTWKDYVDQFRRAQFLTPAVPTTLRANLRDYQVSGFQWAARLAAWGAGACLADDMGLGKTLQALTVALSRAPAGPTLVVAPTSVCANWMDEARRFAPTMNPLLFGPGDRKSTLDAAGSYDLIVCSYGLLHQESDRFAAVKWETVVLDEAQAIKNRETLRSQAAMKLDAGFRMLTTGTPIENHLGELWNLFNFINPGLLGAASAFRRRLADPIQNRGDEQATRRLKRLVQPFILRRTKTAVLDELPSRTEITLRIEMPEAERALYETIRQRAVTNLQDGDGSPSHVTILAEIMKLRRACCHPSLVSPEIGIEGAKLEAFSNTVKELLENGHKALVFSQFVDHLRIVRSRLDQLGISYRYLDGSTPARQRKREVDAFQAGEGDLFLISLKSGGLGLNLTAADYVLMLDPWWNPAVEDQAADRAHRIGQVRPVTIYRLVMKDSIEERIVDLHATKRSLAENLLQGADLSGRLSAEELLALIRRDLTD